MELFARVDLEAEQPLTHSEEPAPSVRTWRGWRLPVLAGAALLATAAPAAALLGQSLMAADAGASIGMQTADPEKEELLKLLDKIVDNDGQPNPRVACTDGNFAARKTLEAEMADIGLSFLPKSGGSFIWNVPGSQTDSCKHGLANVMGYVEGTDLKHEFIMLDAHYDGGNLQNNGGGQYVNVRQNSGTGTQTILTMTGQQWPHC